MSELAERSRASIRGAEPAWEPIDFATIATLLRRRSLPLLLPPLLLVSLVLARQARTAPVYQASATIVFASVLTEAGAFSPINSERAINNEGARALSEAALSEAERRLGQPILAGAKAVNSANSLVITTRAGEAASAQAAADAVAAVYLERRHAAWERAVAARRDVAGAKLATLQVELDALDAQLAALRPPGDQASTVEPPPAEVDALTAARDVALRRQAALRNELRALAGAAQAPDGAQLAGPATASDGPISQGLLAGLALALLVGSALGAGATFALERADRRVRCLADVSRLGQGLRPLAQVRTRSGIDLAEAARSQLAGAGARLELDDSSIRTVAVAGPVDAHRAAIVHALAAEASGRTRAVGSEAARPDLADTPAPLVVLDAGDPRFPATLRSLRRADLIVLGAPRSRTSATELTRIGQLLSDSTTAATFVVVIDDAAHRNPLTRRVAEMPKRLVPGGRAASSEHGHG
ncbi:MAG: hypothetical protein OEY23_22085 [Acidimicrobiia bacterium]|nr:hypothetical protein [Acidimicrobiia bacterium]